MPHIKIEHLKSTRGFETEYGVSIDQRIQTGRTKLYRSRAEAEEDAVGKRRYAYPVFDSGIINGFWAVPD